MVDVERNEDVEEKDEKSRDMRVLDKSMRRVSI